MNTFPILTYLPYYMNFNEELDDEAVVVADKASGYPVQNKLFTFQALTFEFTLYLVIQADKETIITFYKDNKDVPFNWLGPDGVTYEVIFAEPPECDIIARGNLWQVSLGLIQNAPVV